MRCSLLLIVTAFVVGCVAVPGQDRASVDLPPAGALLRLGTLRATTRVGGGHLALSPDGQVVAAGDGPVRLFDVASGEPLASLDTRGTVRFGPQGRWVAVSGGGPARFFATSDGAQLPAPPADAAASLGGLRDRRVPELESADGGWRTLADCTVEISDALTGRVVREIRQSWDSYPVIDVSPDGRLLAVADRRGVRVFDIATGDRSMERRPWSAAAQLRFSPDGSLLACRYRRYSTGERPLPDQTVVISVPQGTNVTQPVDAESIGSPGVLAFSPDGSRLLRSRDHFVLELLDVQTGSVLLSLPPLGGEAMDAAFSRDGLRIVTCDFEGRIRSWDAADGTELHPLPGHQGRIQGIAVSPDGRLIATASRDRTVRLWDAATGAEIRHVATGGGNVCAVAFSPRGDRLAVGGDAVRLFDPVTGAECRVLQAPEFVGASAVAFSPDGASLAATGMAPETGPPAAPSVKLWNLDRAAVAFEAPCAGVSALAFAPDGELVASASGGEIRLLDPQTGAITRTLGGARGNVHDLCWSPDGTALASGEDGRIRVLEARTGEERWRAAFRPPVAWSPDGHTLACGADPARMDAVLLLDAATGRVLGEFRDPGNVLTCLVWSPDGSRLLSGDMHGSVTVWDAGAYSSTR